MDDPWTVRVTLTYGDTLTEGVGGWSTRVTLTPGTTLTVRSVRVTLDSKSTAPLDITLIYRYIFFRNFGIIIILQVLNFAIFTRE